jgi:hypothetical protein
MSDMHALNCFVPQFGFNLVLWQKAAVLGKHTRRTEKPTAMKR